ncbi:MAG: serine/threonine protein kinase [Deltaproteobacteria bacterium]|nr:serine/threonine protein kinase [Deltaproteobacteria bacterium]
MPFGRVAYLCAQVAGSVEDAHAAGIVHRDLKPENIVISEGRDGETAKVLDFGLAKLFAGTVETQVTSAGTIVGTPYYMSPEQIHGQDLDGRSDVYALGAIMYECVPRWRPVEALVGGASAAFCPFAAVSAGRSRRDHLAVPREGPRPPLSNRRGG